jgi:hypothetical protein
MNVLFFRLVQAGAWALRNGFRISYGSAKSRPLFSNNSPVNIGMGIRVRSSLDENFPFLLECVSTLVCPAYRPVASHCFERFLSGSGFFVVEESLSWFGEESLVRFTSP